MRVLVVEDEVDLAEFVRRSLEEHGFFVDVAHDGEEGLFLALSTEYDAIVLDLMLPGRDGWDVLGRLREQRSTPVLILTAREAVDDRVRGLDDGADDYLTKPFELKELRARLRALIRRSAGKCAGVLRVGEVAVDPATRTVSQAGADVPMSRREYAITEYLVMHQGELVTRTALFEHVYDAREDTASNVIDVHISNIRRKLGRDFVRTRRGHGYIIDA